MLDGEQLRLGENDKGPIVQMVSGLEIRHGPLRIYRVIVPGEWEGATWGVGTLIHVLPSATHPLETSAAT